MISLRLGRLIALLCVITLSSQVSCERKKVVALEPLPSIHWVAPEALAFMSKEQWAGQPLDWTPVSSALRNTFTPPDALETKLLVDDRLLWKSVLSNYENYLLYRHDASLLSNLQVTAAESCLPPSSAFSLHQRAQIQLMLQQHRNVLWRLGLLEMASRFVSNTAKSFVELYAEGRIRDADQAVVQPIFAIMRQIETLKSAYQSPNGAWKPGELHFRIARLVNAAPIYLRAQGSIVDWNVQVSNSERWQYLANTAEPVILSLKTWVSEYETLISAFGGLSASALSLEQSFAPPNDLVAYPCIRHNLRLLRIFSGLYDALIPMQWELTRASDSSQKLLERLGSVDYAGVNQEFLTSELLAFMDALNGQRRRLSRSEDLLLILWDASNYEFWTGLPEFIDPIRHFSKPAVEDEDVWLAIYQGLSGDLLALSGKAEAEPIQPNDRRGKPYPPYISTILETLRSPARIDEVERGLLAISELEAHMVAIRDELLRLCKDGACRGFPEAELSNSPRNSPWVSLWRQSPVNERTLGHSLIVLKLCQLHLSRLTQRLAEIYAWFAETSNADISWKKLKSWQRIWTLYGEPNGTYASFLRSISALDSKIVELSKPFGRRAESPNLLEILRIQSKLFELTVDFSRFIDARHSPPVGFEELDATWDGIAQQLLRIESLTKARDLSLAAE